MKVMRRPGPRLFALVVIVLTFVVLILWALSTRATDRRLCQVLHGMVANSRATIGQPGTPGYAYYKEHPDELDAAKAQTDGYLALLDCAHLPTAGG